MRIFSLNLFILLVSCFLSGQEYKSVRTANFGDVEIKIPVLEGMQECYKDPAVKVLADATESPMNEVLAYYLTNKIYEERDSLAEIAFDDFLKFYGTTQISRVSVGKKELNEMQSMVGSQFEKLDWGKTEALLQERFEGVELSQPKLLETYQINDESFTLLMVASYSNEVGTTPRVISMSGILLADRLVWMAYYLDYKEEETLERIKVKTKVIVEAVQAIN